MRRRHEYFKDLVTNSQLPEKPLGTWEALGSLPGTCATADPLGRFILVQRGRSTCAVYETTPTLSERFVTRLSGPSAQLLLHPSGDEIARLTYDSALEVTRRDGTRLLINLDNSFDAAFLEKKTEQPMRYLPSLAWISYTACGRYLLLGGVHRERQRAYVRLLDAKTLQPLDEVCPLLGYPECQREEMMDWAEGAELAVMPLPHCGVAVSTAAGDTTMMLAIIEVVAQKLVVCDLPLLEALHGASSLERIMGLGFCAQEKTLLVLDSDHLPTQLRWGAPRVEAGSWPALLRFTLTNGKPLEAQVRSWSAKGDNRCELSGDFTRAGGVLLALIEEERAHERFYYWVGQAFLLLDAASLLPLGWCWAPLRNYYDRHRLFGGGLFLKQLRSRVRLWRFSLGEAAIVSPEEP